MAIIRGEDVVIMTKDDTRKLLGWLRGGVPRMTKERLGQLQKEGLLDMISDLVNAIREPEDDDED